MKKRGFLQISFPWLFAIIVGIIILFLTIYGITRAIRTEETVQDIKTSKNIGILLNPLETGFESAKSTPITFPVETRISNICSDFGDFGTQSIKVSQQSLNKWTDAGIPIDFPNKYIFSKDPVEGKKVYVFAKPFEFPFKIADLMYIVSVNDIYCFNDAPGDIQDELEDLDQSNFAFDNCSDLDNVINVCYEGGSDCDILVNYGARTIEWVDKLDVVDFDSDALMYAGIFSDPEIYECQLKRLMKRTAQLAQLYIDKANVLASKGCTSNLRSDLELLISQANALGSSQDLFPIKNNIVDSIQRSNSANTGCKLW